MGVSHDTEYRDPVITTATTTVDDIHYIAVHPGISKHILEIITEVQELFGSNGDSKMENKPSYSKLIQSRLGNFNVIKANILDNKYKNVGEILGNLDSVWKSMYELTSKQQKNNESHDPNSDFITFASGIEAEFYRLWEKFEDTLIKRNYLRQKSTSETSNKYFVSNTQEMNKPKKERNEETKEMKMEKSNCRELKDWLTNIVKLPKYYNAFVDNGFDDLSFVIGMIREQDLIMIGIDKVGHRRKILHLADSPDNKKRTTYDDDSYNNNNNYDHDNDFDMNQPPKKRRKIFDNQ